MCARRFLFVIFILTLLVVAAAFAIFEWGGNVLLRQATPRGHFEAAEAGSSPDYANFDSWIARPGIGDDPSNWLPEGVARAGAPARRHWRRRPPLTCARRFASSSAV